VVLVIFVIFVPERVRSARLRCPLQAGCYKFSGTGSSLGVFGAGSLSPPRR
jgi:hypothetical protein